MYRHVVHVFISVFDVEYDYVVKFDVNAHTACAHYAHTCVNA